MRYCDISNDITGAGSSINIHPGAVSIELHPLISQVCAIGIDTECDIAACRSVLVGDRLGGNGGWGRAITVNPSGVAIVLAKLRPRAVG